MFNYDCFTYEIEFDPMQTEHIFVILSRILIKNGSFDGVKFKAIHDICINEILREFERDSEMEVVGGGVGDRGWRNGIGKEDEGFGT